MRPIGFHSIKYILSVQHETHWVLLYKIYSLCAAGDPLGSTLQNIFSLCSMRPIGSPSTKISFFWATLDTSVLLNSKGGYYFMK